MPRLSPLQFQIMFTNICTKPQQSKCVKCYTLPRSETFLCQILAGRRALTWGCAVYKREVDDEESSRSFYFLKLTDIADTNILVYELKTIGVLFLPGALGDVIAVICAPATSLTSHIAKDKFGIIGTSRWRRRLWNWGISHTVQWDCALQTSQWEKSGS